MAHTVMVNPQGWPQSSGYGRLTVHSPGWPSRNRE